MAKLIRKGGKGSGNWGHAGRPGKVGGSAPQNKQPALFDIEPYIERSDSAMNPYQGDNVSGGTRKLGEWIDSASDSARDDAVARIAKDTGLDPIDVEVILEEYHNGVWDEPEVIDAAMAMAFGDTFGLTFDGKLDAMNLEQAQKVAAVIKSMYDQTQLDLKAMGIKNVEVYRMLADDYGSDELAKMYPGAEILPEGAAQGWAIEAYNAASATDGDDVYASDHLFILMKTVVPADRILSTGVTGFGSTDTGDVIVIGRGDEKDTAVVDATNNIPHEKAWDYYSRIDPYPGLAAAPDREAAMESGQVIAELHASLSGNMGVELSPFSSSGIQYSEADLAAVVKNDVVSHLSETTGVGYDEANAFVHQWAKTSNAHENSAFIQATTKRLFGDKFGTDFSSFQRKNVESYGNDSAREGFADKQDMFYSESPSEARGAADKLMKEMYNRTQEQLDELGVDGVWLYRGIVGDTKNISKGDKISLNENAIESWTSDPHVAKSFSEDETTRAGYVVRTYIPKERILSTPYSGFGCQNESEFVVIGANLKDGAGNVVDDTAEVVELKRGYDW